MWYNLPVMLYFELSISRIQILGQRPASLVEFPRGFPQYIANSSGIGHNHLYLHLLKSLIELYSYNLTLYRGADKSLARSSAKIRWKSSRLEFLESRRHPPH
jgi:hypothetical protein